MKYFFIVLSVLLITSNVTAQEVRKRIPTIAETKAAKLAEQKVMVERKIKEKHCPEILGNITHQLRRLKGKDLRADNYYLAKTTLWTRLYADMDCNQLELKRVYEAMPQMRR